jgi:hypothetical protein
VVKQKGRAVILAAVFAVACLAPRTALARQHRHRVHAAEWRAFPPSRQSLIDQNAAADALGLPVIRTSKEMQELAQAGELVRLRTTAYLQVQCPQDRAVVRPWAADFITGLAQDFYATFGKPLRINSATRPQAVQRRLLRWNRNAAPVHGETASVHMRGIAVDIARRGLTGKELAYLQARLAGAVVARRVIVEEELRQPCFHTVVMPAPVS